MSDLRDQIVAAIQSARTNLQWKPGSIVRHLLKRKLRGHLPIEATIDHYEQIIFAVLNDSEAEVYIYRHNDVPYFAVVSAIQDQTWLVMFTPDNLIESAFVVERPNYYLNKSAFERIGPLNEVLK